MSLSAIYTNCFFGGEFKPIEIYCPKCNKKFKSHVEKQSDVAMSTEILDDFFQSKCEAIILIGGDSDQLPVIKKIKSINPIFEIFSLFPPFRKSMEITNILGEDHCRNMQYKRLLKNQFPDPVIANGKMIYKPSEYK